MNYKLVCALAVLGAPLVGEENTRTAPQLKEVARADLYVRDPFIVPDPESRTYYLYKIAQVTGEYLDDADVGYDQYGKPEVNCTFGRAGERKFRVLTRNNIGRRMAVILDARVRSSLLALPEWCLG